MPVATATVTTTTTTTTTPSSAFTGIVIGLISSFGSIVLVALLIFVFWLSGCAGNGRILLDRLGRPGEYDDEQAFLREEAEALETMDDMARAEYLRAKAYVTANPPESVQTEISLSQFLAIQEKGVAAWEFEPELEIANCFVEGRTEIEFFDTECTVMTNLPVPKQNEVYYWEAKIYEKAESTMLSIGMATKPYPLFRLPGFHRYSVGYQSDGRRRYNQPFSSHPYGPPLVQGDVVGVGYRPRTGAIFFTRNGKRLEEVVHGLKVPNFFPTIGAIGQAIIHVNLGQEGFVFIEANVKKWGLAPVTGSLAPPPPYGSEQGSILLETGAKDGQPPTGSLGRGHSHSLSGSPFIDRVSSHLTPSHGRSRSGNFRIMSPTSPGPVRSPTDISLTQLARSDEPGEASSSAVVQQPIPDPSSRDDDDDEEASHDDNPLHLHLEDATNPPPDYTSPDQSINDEQHSPRSSLDSNEDQPLMTSPTRHRGTSSAAPPNRPPQPIPQGQRHQTSPQIPSYSDAVRQGAVGQAAPYHDDSSDSEPEAVSDTASEAASDSGSAHDEASSDHSDDLSRQG